MRKQASRVSICLALTAMAAGAAIGCAETPDLAGPSPVSSNTAAASSFRSVTDSAADVSFPVGPELAAVRRATAQFHDIAVANAAAWADDVALSAAAAGRASVVFDAMSPMRFS